MWAWAYSALEWLVTKLPTVDIPSPTTLFAGFGDATGWLSCFVDMSAVRAVALAVVSIETGIMGFDAALFVLRRLPFGK